MREELKKRLRSQSLLKTGIILITYIFILYHISDIFSEVNKLGVLLTPFVFGFVIAYLLNPIIEWIHCIILKIFKKDVKSGICLVFGYLFVFILILFLCVKIFPQLWYSVDIIIREIPTSLDSGYKWLETEGVKYLSQITNNNIELQDILNMFTTNLDSLMENLSQGMSKIVTATVGFTTFLFNLILGILISIYMLAHKNTYKGQTKKAIYAFFSEKRANQILLFFSDVHTTFSKFINARIIDSTIIGILCYIGCLIFEFDNAVLIACIVGITNVIPYFGPFLGAIPCALIVLLQGPAEMVGFCVFILVLQQFDGNILGPKLLGNSLGLTSLWIIFAVVIMTGLFGIVGMVIGVPLFTIIYMLIKELIYVKLMKKGKSLETADYINSKVDLDFIDLHKYKEKRNEDKVEVERNEDE